LSPHRQADLQGKGTTSGNQKVGKREWHQDGRKERVATRTKERKSGNKVGKKEWQQECRKDRVATRMYERKSGHKKVKKKEYQQD
jgi:hypothetical protein